MAKLFSSTRKSLPKSSFGLPGKRAYPMPDKTHANLAKAMASRYATSSQKKEIDAKANKVLGGNTGTVNHKSGCGGNHLGAC